MTLKRYASHLIIPALFTAMIFYVKHDAYNQGYADAQAEFAAAAARAQIEAQEERRNQEQTLQELANEADSATASETGRIDDLYRLSLADFGIDFSPCRLFEQAGSKSAAGESDVSDTPQAAGGAAATGENERYREDAKRFQRLYEAALATARDCDITAAHYNELLRLWNGARETLAD